MTPLKKRRLRRKATAGKRSATTIKRRTKRARRVPAKKKGRRAAAGRTVSSKSVQRVPARPPKRRSSGAGGASRKFSRKELSVYRDLLLRERERLVGEIQHITGETLMRSQKDATGELSGYAFHMADLASDNYDREFSLGVASDEQRIIYLIDEALKRIDEKGYGICVECNGRIPKNRLKALPYAKMCIDCQERVEKSLPRES